MTHSLPRAPQIGSQQVVETLRKLAAEVGGLKAFEPGVREAIGNTNWTVLMQRLDEAGAALSRTAQAPVADGVREAAQILLSEIDSATDMDCVIAASSALRTALASSDPTPATEAGGDEVAAQRLAASPLSSSSGAGWRPIESAPKDGTRIIVKAVTFGWSSDVCQNVATGDKAVEARWAKDLSGEYKWLEWCGNDRTYSTGGALVPLGWLPLPAAPVSDGDA